MTAAKYEWLSFICFGIKLFFFRCVFLVFRLTENNGQTKNIFDLAKKDFFFFLKNGFSFLNFCKPFFEFEFILLKPPDNC
jgi:hypothetical protein